MAMIAIMALSWILGLEQQVVLEPLYVLGGRGGGVVVDVVDVETGQVLRTISTNATFPQSGLTYGGGRLVAVHRGSPPWGPDISLQIHPADGQVTWLGQTGQNWSTAFTSIAYDSTKAETYVVWVDEVYRMEADGSLTFLSLLQGLLFADGITAMAIDSQGNAWGVGAVGNLDKPVYSLDLNGGRAHWQGSVLTPNGDSIKDMDFSSSGRLWGLLFQNGLCEIDLGSMTAQLVHPNIAGWSVAFAPETVGANYCASKTTSVGCQPTIEGEGVASPTATSGFVVRAANIRNRQFGTLLYGLSGQAKVPFAGGLTCVQKPWIRTPIVDSGGNSGPMVDCSGSWSIDLNTEMAKKPPLPAGTVVNCQWMGRDPGFASPNNYSLSDGLELTLLP